MNKNLIFGFVIAMILTLIEWKFKMSSQNIWLVGVIAFLISYPWKIGKHVFSLFGGLNEDEEGSIYSIFAVIQIAKKDCLTITGLTFLQKAGNNAWQVFGLVLYQKAGNNAWQVFGLALYQKAGNNAEQLFGLVLYQKAGNNAWQLFGLALYQKAGNNAEQVIGFRGWVEGNLIRQSFLSIHAYHQNQEKPEGILEN